MSKLSKNGILDFQYVPYKENIVPGDNILIEIKLTQDKNDIEDDIFIIEKYFRLTSDTINKFGQGKIIIPVIFIENEHLKKADNLILFFEKLVEYKSDVIVLGLNRDQFRTFKAAYYNCNWKNNLNLLFYIECDENDNGPTYYVPEILMNLRFDIDKNVVVDKLNINFLEKDFFRDRESKKPNLFHLSKYSLKLLEFDTLVSINDMTLFELYTMACLEKKILQNSDQEDLIDKNKLPAYKIADIHFKIGKNIHVNDYYYDNKLFLNVFFANRFAISISKYIISSDLFSIKHGLDDKTNVIVGYSKHTEFLLLEIKNSLNKYYKTTFPEQEIKFDFNIIENDSKFQFSFKNENSHNKKYLILVATGLTLATCVKIYNYFIEEEKIEDKNICRCFLNLLFSNELGDIKDVQNYFRWEFGVKNIKDKIINIENKSGNNLSSSNTQKRVKYFIDVKRKWSIAKNCLSCFPEDNCINEVPIIESNKIYTIPVFFDNKFPYYNLDFKSLKIFKKNIFKIDPDYYYYGHQEYNNRELNHIIDSKYILRDIDNIKDWLKHLCNNYFFDKSNETVLFVLDEGLYTGFVDILNKIVFEEKALIIYYDIKNDLNQNFNIIYGEQIKNAKSIYFVDDLILTGKNFMASNNIIKQYNQKFDGLFSLFVRADNFVIKNINSEIDKDYFFAFNYFRVPSLTENNTPCPICEKRKLYHDIAQNCSLNTLKTIFLEKNKELKLIPHSELKNRKIKLIDYEPAVSLTDYYSDNGVKIIKIIENLELKLKYKNIIKFIITDLLFTLNNENSENSYFNNITTLSELNEDIFKRINKYKDNYFYDEIADLSIILNLNKCKEYIIKILSLPPFVYYYEIRKCIFRWMIVEAENTFDTLNEIMLNADFFDVKKLYENLRYLKLLFKRLAGLKSSYLLRVETLNKLRRIYSYNKIKNILENSDTQKTQAISILKTIYLTPSYNYTEYEFKTLLINIAGQNFTNKYIDEITKYTEKDLFPVNDVLQKIPNNFKIKYLSQLIYSIDNVVNAINNYQYFIASCVKEIIHNNYEKELYLEENIDKLYVNEGRNNISENVDFSRLLLLFKLENIGIINNAIRFVYNQFSKNNENLNMKLNYIHNLFIQYINRDVTLRNFLSTEIKNNYLSSSKYIHNPFHSIIENYLNLYKELNDVQESYKNIQEQRNYFDTKIKKILEYISTILGIEGNEKNITLSIKYKTKAIDENSRDDIYTFSMDRYIGGNIIPNSFIPNMMDGVRARPGGPTQTIVEYALRNGIYSTIVDQVFEEKSSEEITINSMAEFENKKYGSILFFRIANIKYDDEEEVLQNIGQAVIFVGLKSGEGKFYEHERLRYLLLIKEPLSIFLNKNVGNEGFKAYIEERKENVHLNLNMHGLKPYFECMDDLIYRNGTPDKKTEFFQLLIYQSHRILQIKRNKYNDISYKEIRKERLITIIDEIIEYIYPTRRIMMNMNIPKNYKENLINYNLNFSFIMHEDILKIILSELIVNIKKYSYYLREDDRILTFDIITEIKNGNKIQYLKVTNTFDVEVRDLLRDKNEGVHGLRMIYGIFIDIYQNFYFYTDEDGNEFYTFIPLINFKSTKR